jgi:hypothetical protein
MQIATILNVCRGLEHVFHILEKPVLLLPLVDLRKRDNDYTLVWI